MYIYIYIHIHIYIYIYMYTHMYIQKRETYGLLSFVQDGAVLLKILAALPAGDARLGRITFVIQKYVFVSDYIYLYKTVAYMFIIVCSLSCITVTESVALSVIMYNNMMYLPVSDNVYQLFICLYENQQLFLIAFQNTNLFIK